MSLSIENLGKRYVLGSTSDEGGGFKGTLRNVRDRRPGRGSRAGTHVRYAEACEAPCLAG